MSHALDDRAYLAELDPKGILALTEKFPEQCREAKKIADDAELPVLESTPSVVALTGMGGSAAGGDFVRAMFEAHGGAAFVVNRDYNLPHYIGLGDLVFCASYSGNTEETLSAYEDAKKLGAKIVVVSSGGKLSDLARAEGHSVITVPGGQPPRTAMGYMMIPVFVACQRLKLIPEQDYDSCLAELQRCVGDWTVEKPFDSNPTKQLAQAFSGKLPVLYGLGVHEGIVASRWKSQIHENSKTMAFANSFPELNHNEILGWVGAGKQGVSGWVGALLEFGNETSKMQTRAAVTEKLIGSLASFTKVTARGSDLLTQMLTLAFFGDFVSVYLARLAGVDPENIDSIDTLKAVLAKVS